MKNNHYLSKLLSYLGFNAKEFAESLGFKRVDRIYQILNGRNGVSSDLAKIIIGKYPNIDYDWLLTGKGEMLKSNMPSNENSVEVATLKSEVKRLDELLKEKERQIQDKNKIIALLEQQHAGKPAHVDKQNTLVSEGSR